MIPPVPPNFGFSLLAIPVWGWEEQPAPPTDAAAASCEGEAASGEPAPLEKRLVFLGYEWRSAVEWSLFPDAPWDHGFEDQTGAIRDGALRQEREQQTQQSALAKPHNANSHGAEHSASTTQVHTPETPSD